MWAVNLFLVATCYCISVSYIESFPCPPNIKRFQAPDKTSFYECENRVAILKQCGNGTQYIPYEKKCIPFERTFTRKRRDTSSVGSTSSSNRPKTIKQQALGQSATLGSLYNRKTDEYFIEKNLWQSKSVEESQLKLDRKYSNNKFFAGKTSAEKLDKMDISAELKMSFMAGLIEVGGSAQFFRESSVFDNEEVFNMAYHATTHTLYMPTSIDVNNKIYCTAKDVTHVVSSVTYGLNAFFNFRKTVSTSSERQELAGTLQAMVKSIPSFSIEGTATLKIEGTRKTVFDQTRVSLNGDFLLDFSPTTFEDAIRAYKKITGLLSNTDTSNAQIVEVKLSPITEYCTSADVTLVRISQQAMQTVTDTLDNLEKTKIKVETLLNTRAAKRFLPVRKNLNAFRNALKRFQNNMKSQLITLLPQIKGDVEKKSETDLIMMLNKYYSSPFDQDKSSTFLTSRKREIQALIFLLDHFKSSTDNVIVTDYEAANDVEILLKNPRVVVFDINILVPTITTMYLAGKLDETSIWFNKPEEVKTVGNLVNMFKDFANSNKKRKGFAYLIKVNKRTTKPTLIQANGKIFNIPQAPNDLKLKHRSYNSITFATIEKPNNSWIKHFTVSYWKTTEGYSYKKDKVIQFSSNDFVIHGLEAATTYQFQISFDTDFGRSPSSKETDMISTRPTSPPSNLQIKQQTESSITVTWSAPAYIRKGLKITKYSATLYDKSMKTIASLTMKNHEVTFTMLQAYHEYLVQVTAYVDNVNSNPEDIQTLTAPPSPKAVTIKEIDLNAITIQWVKPTIIPTSTNVEYIVRYTMMNTNGRNTIDGTEKTISRVTEPLLTIRALAEGTYYQFQVKVVTVKGSSKFSPMTSAKTNYKQTKLDKLKENINTELIQPDIRRLKNSITVLQNSINTAIAQTDRSLKSKVELNKDKINSLRVYLESTKREATSARTELQSGIKADIDAVNKKVILILRGNKADYTCKGAVTQYDDNGGDNGKIKVQFLDRHSLGCSPKNVLTSFQLQNKLKEQKYRYTGKCCSNGKVGSSTVKRTDYSSGGNGKFTSLTNQKVVCTGDSLLSGFQLEATANVALIRYKYTCSTAVRYDCTTHYTGYDAETDSMTVLLDRHAVKCPGAKGLAGFQLQRQNSKVRYEYTCCSY